jgi:predicted nuclease with RNAse H fold
MLTLGIDLASQPKRTAMALIDWRDGRAVVDMPVSPLSDEAALQAMHAADWVGIDAPFGWPDLMVRAVGAFADEGTWLDDGDVERLRFRLTDQHVHDQTGIWPLSVSSDRIALPAWRCAGLLWKHAGYRVDRLGGDRVVEVYPGAALTLWAFQRRGYKRSGNAGRQAAQRATRERLVEEIAVRAADWLDLSAAHEACVASDDALDAVLAALVTRAMARKMTWEPPAKYLATIEKEGWIHLPKPGTFDRLADDAA